MAINVAKLMDAVTILETGRKPKYRVDRGDAGEIISKAFMLLSIHEMEEIDEVMATYRRKAEKAGITEDTIKAVTKKKRK